jgi:hypothetical protein
MSDIPNRPEFQKLMTILKDEHGNEIELICTENGYNTFYNLYKNTGLFSVSKAIEKLSEVFDSDYFTGPQSFMIASIPERNRDRKECFLHMSRKQKAKISRTLEDVNRVIRCSESQFGIVCCIFTYNYAKEKFKGLRTEKFRSYYDDSGYVKIVKDEIKEATKSAGFNIVKLYPVFLNIAEENAALASNSELKKCEERKEDLKYQIKALEYAIDAINRIELTIPQTHQLTLETIKDKSNGTFTEPLEPDLSPDLAEESTYIYLSRIGLLE